MADYEQIMQALRNAHAAGDTEGAKRLAVMAKEARAKPDAAVEYMKARERGEMPAPVAMSAERVAQQAAIDAPVAEAAAQREKISAGGAAGLGLGQGVSFGLMDEAAARIASALPNLTYDEALANARGSLSQAREDRPILTGGSEMAGAVGTSLLTGGAMGLGRAGMGLGARAAQGAAVGAGEGALYGFGSGEGVGDRMAGAAQYGAMGAGLGAAAPLAVEGVRRGADLVIGGPVAALRSGASETRAGQAIVKQLQAAGMSADDINAAVSRAAQEGQPEFRAVDAMGRGGQRLLSSVARTTPEAQDEIANFLIGRQSAQGERLGRVLSDALQAPDTAAARQAALTKARSEAANIAYEAARKGAGPVDVRGAIAAIDDRIGPMQGSGVSGDGIDAALSKFRNRLAAKTPPSGEISRELSDFDRVLGVKKDVQDAIGAAVRAGRNNEARELGGLMSQLDSALEEASAGYRAANDEFARASRVIDQIEAGKASAGPRARSEDVLSAYGAMTPEQQAAFRAGRADVDIARIGSAAEGANKARPLTSGKAQVELPAMAQDPEMLRRQIARENAMFETGRKTLGGSETAERLGDDARLSQDAMGVIANLLSGNLKAAAQKVGGGVANAATGQNVATRKMIAEALMSPDLARFVQPALTAGKKAAGQNRIVEAIIRATPRPIR